MEPFVPKSMGLYVVDDAVDVMDVLHISTTTGVQFRNEKSFEHRVKDALSHLSMKDMRGGITRLADRATGIHINAPLGAKRPPLGALIMSVKVMNGMQVIDYLCGATAALFGQPAIVATFEGYKPVPTHGKMPAYLRDWLCSQFGVVYGADCTVVAIERTFAA